MRTTKLKEARISFMKHPQDNELRQQQTQRTESRASILRTKKQSVPLIIQPALASEHVPLMVEDEQISDETLTDSQQIEIVRIKQQNE